MKCRRGAPCLLGVVLLLVGCGTGGEPGASTTAAEPTTAATSAGAEVPASSITCSSPRPRGAFRYSSDHDELAGLVAAIGDEVGGSSGSFDDVDANELGILMQRHFVDPSSGTNASPTMWAFHRFLCDHPGVRAIGFTANTGVSGAVGPEAIASLETVYAGTVDDALRRDARTFCATASQKTMRTHLECFWD